jgi:hypothetical protein
MVPVRQSGEEVLFTKHARFSSKILSVGSILVPATLFLAAAWLDYGDGIFRYDAVLRYRVLDIFYATAHVWR